MLTRAIKAAGKAAAEIDSVTAENELRFQIGYVFASKALMSKSAEIFWTEDRLRQMAISELLAHGGNKDDLNRLREHLRKTDENKSSDGVIS